MKANGMGNFWCGDEGSRGRMDFFALCPDTVVAGYQLGTLAIDVDGS